MLKNTSTPSCNQHTFQPLLLALTGPTASGKSEAAVALAEQIKAEILCVDSMQVYQGLNVGTAKPTPEQRRRINHHGLDLVSPLEPFSASKFAERTEPIVAEAVNNNRPLILCGGTGLYFRALLEGFFQTPEPNAELRATLKRRLAEIGPQALYQELRQIDPAAAETIHPNDSRRVLRALEIVQQTGHSVSALQARQSSKPWITHTLFLGLKRSKEDLARRVQLRTEWMYDNGLIEETQWLIQLGCDENHPAFQALGYKECANFLRQKLTLNEAIALTKQNTQRYAKRQMTWFRRQFNTHWLAPPQNGIQEIVQESLRVWKNRGNNTL